MRPLRLLILLLLALIPLSTLVHRDETGHWDTQRSAMAAPDEFSYLLQAQHFLHGGGLSLQDSLGRDTYFPPGYPLLLAAWGKCFGLTAFTAHAFNATLLSLATLVVYSFSRRLLLQLALAPGPPLHLKPPAASLLALLITGIFATNWHVLETSLLIMSEPAFMLAVFAWLALAVRWSRWHSNPLQALALALLAVAAWSIRGAGITCVAATALYPLWVWCQERFSRQAFLKHWAPLSLAIVLPLLYQIILSALSPEKSLASGQDSANSYTKQLLHGLLETGPAPDGVQGLHLWLLQAAAIAQNLYRQIFGHLDDFANSFVPWLRENPDLHFRDIIGKLFAFFALLGFGVHALACLGTSTASEREDRLKPELRAYEPRAGFLELFILMYLGLYLLWPFNMARFWSPILPVMLVYAADAVMRFSERLKHIPRPALAGVLLALLFILAAEEDLIHLGHYARRLNYVSDALRDAARTVVRLAPDPKRTIVTGMNDDELFAMAWYFSQIPGGTGYQVRVPEPHLPANNGGRERSDQLLLRSYDDITTPPPGKQLFFIVYFPNSDAREALEKLQANRAGQNSMPAARIRKAFQRGIEVSLWQIAPTVP